MRMANTVMKDNKDDKNFRTIARAPTSRIDESFENSFGLKKWA